MELGRAWSRYQRTVLITMMMFKLGKACTCVLRYYSSNRNILIYTWKHLSRNFKLFKIPSTDETLCLIVWSAQCACTCRSMYLYVCLGTSWRTKRWFVKPFLGFFFLKLCLFLNKVNGTNHFMNNVYFIYNNNNKNMYWIDLPGRSFSITWH